MKLTCPVFDSGEIIPSLYTCEGKNSNPELVFHDVPPTAKSLVLIMDDPDVPPEVRPDRMYDHWIVYNMPPTIKGIPADTKPSGLQGKNTSGKTGYIGPCPPDREHRYFFKLYALGIMLDLDAGATKKEVEKAMKGHILAEAELMGKYEKGQGY